MRCWFSSFVKVDARMEKHCRTRAAVSSMDCYWSTLHVEGMWGGHFGLKFGLDDGEDCWGVSLIEEGVGDLRDGGRGGG